ncbi:MAG: hypothetical protein ACI8T6_000559 [Candidatus Poseidoniaceae archaeon]
MIPRIKKSELMLFSTEKHLNGNTSDVLAHRLVVIQRVRKGNHL